MRTLRLNIRKATLTITILMFLLALPFTAYTAGITIEGRVLTESGALANAIVSAHSSYSELQKDAPPVASTKASEEGLFNLSLPGGSYYFTARGEQSGRSFFAYHGSNPVKVAKENFWLGLMATPLSPPPLYTGGPTGVEGIVTYKGKPLTGAYLAIYKPDSSTFKGLGVRTESIGADGRFKLNVEPGYYVVTARNIENGKSNRPLQPGELYCYYSRSPLEIKADQTARIEMSCYPKGNRDDFVNVSKVKTDKIRSLPELAASAKYGIRGKVTDQDGMPVSGMNVLAYRLTAPVFMMYHVYHGSEFSAVTDQQGSFFIPLDSDGDYGLVARDTLGDGPHRGEMYGLYQGNVRHAVSFKQGQLIDKINIVASRVMDGSGQQQPNPSPQNVIGILDGPPVLLKDTVISQDTIWQGEIIIHGVVNVNRGATLTIRPGTTIKFKNIDRDGNKVGDGEILVEGRLIAKGTSEKRIRFASAEENPAAGDWSYLQFIASDKGNVIENCSFEHAFAGVMIHYADVKISNTLFRNNNRGVHYNTADLELDHSTFVNNRIGIRFMRMEGNVKISNNHITQNDVGVLFVRQHVNAVNFGSLNRGQEAPKYEANNIHANRSYNFSLGEEQERDINVAGNWWGVTSKKEVGDMMYDRSKDSSLSQIHYEPFLDKPVTGAGVTGLSPEFIFGVPESSTAANSGHQLPGVLSGRFLQADGAPLSDALLFLYNLAKGPLPSRSSYWRIPNLTAEIDRDGRFSIMAPPGEYSIGAIKRASGQQIGPPGPGDTFLLSLDKTGRPAVYSMKPGAQTYLGNLRDTAAGTTDAVSAEPSTSIEGSITDQFGKPLEGVMVFAFDNPNVAGKPVFVSRPSDTTGKFRLNVSEGGTYYLKARGDLGGGPPQNGLIIDGNKLEPLAEVSVNTGRTTRGIVLKTKTFPGRGRINSVKPNL